MKCYCVVDFRAPLQEMDQPTPVPQGAQVLLKVRAAGVCHSDIHLWEGGYDLGQGRTLSLKERGVTLPLTMGHETVGAVVSAGPDATGLRPGGNYLVYPWIGCGNCPSCQAGQENHCMAPACLGVHRAGGYADHVLVPHSRYLIDIGDLDPAQIAPYACSGLTTYAALKKIGEQTYRQHPVVIFGAGGLGLMCLTLIKALGGAGAIVVDIDPPSARRRWRQARWRPSTARPRTRRSRSSRPPAASRRRPPSTWWARPPPLRWPSTS